MVRKSKKKEIKKSLSHNGKFMGYIFNNLENIEMRVSIFNLWKCILNHVFILNNKTIILIINIHYTQILIKYFLFLLYQTSSTSK